MSAEPLSDDYRAGYAEGFDRGWESGVESLQGELLNIVAAVGSKMFTPTERAGVQKALRMRHELLQSGQAVSP